MCSVDSVSWFCRNKGKKVARWVRGVPSMSWGGDWRGFVAVHSSCWVNEIDAWMDGASCGVMSEMSMLPRVSRRSTLSIVGRRPMKEEWSSEEGKYRGKEQTFR